MISDIGERYRNLEIGALPEEPIPPLVGEHIMSYTKSDVISCLESASSIDNIQAEIGLLKKQSLTRGSLSCFQDLLPGVQSLEDVQSWVVANFGGASGAGGDNKPDFSIWGNIKDTGMSGPTFGPF
jgi:hypothetical protein